MQTRGEGRSTRIAATAATILLLAICPVGAQEVVGPDVLYTNMGSITHYGQVGSIHGYALGSHTCNIGNQNLLWTNNGTPGLAMNAYRLHDNRLDQIGMSWVKHACCAAAGNGCGLSCNGAGGNVLGAGCRDVYSSGWNGGQSRLGPRSGINGFTGAFSSISGGSGNAIFRRLQIDAGDLSAANFPGALYFGEGVYVATDDAQSGNAMNNASHKRLTVSPGLDLNEQGAMAVDRPAIYAWRDHGNGIGVPDESVEIVEVDVPNEGRFVCASRVGDNGDGTWRYAYAVFNLNSHRAGGSLTVPTGGGVTITNVGFNDVTYHSGEIYDNTDWNHQIGDKSITWSSPEAHAQNPNSNAIRWGTMYTFWFDADSAPQPGDVSLGLFIPDGPNAVTFPAPGPTPLCSTPNFRTGVAGVSFNDRGFDGFIDARRESTNGVDVTLGLDTFTFEFTTPIENADGTPLDASAFSIEDTAGTAPNIQSVTVAPGGQAVTITLDEHIALQQWTTFGVTGRSQCAKELFDETLKVGYLPADVNNDGNVNPLDLLRFKQYVNNLIEPEVGVAGDYVDADRSGSLNPLDLLAYKQLINGISPPATMPWAGQSLP